MCKDCGCGEDNGVVTKVFTVPGMMCNNCKESVDVITKAIERTGFEVESVADGVQEHSHGLLGTLKRFFK